MLSRRMICFLTIFQIVSGSGQTFQRDSILLKLVNLTRSIVSDNPSRETSAEEEIRYGRGSDSIVRYFGRTMTDDGANSSSESGEMEPPAGKFSFFNLLSDDEEEEEDEENDNEDEKVKYEDEEDEEEEEDDDMDFFGPEEEISSDKVEGLKGGSYLKQYHRNGLRMHNLVFPLLLAYKLKFFTVIPLLLGALVLLVGTTGIAGFFFALFAAALGIHVKSHDQ